MNAFRRGQRRALLHRKFHGVPAGLDARFSPTAVFTDPTVTDDDPLAGIFGTKTSVATAARTSVASLAPVIPTTASSTSTTPVILSTSSVVHVATSNSILASVFSPTVSTPVVNTPSISASSSAPSSSSRAATSASAAASVPVKASSTNSLPAVTHATSTNVSASGVDAAAASTSSAATSSATATHASSTGAIVGGIAAGLLGVVGLCVVIAFFLRRWRNRRDDSVFRPDSFRRSAVLLDSPPTHEDTIQRGFNPPPSMTQRRFDAPDTMSFGTQYGAPGPAYMQNDAYGYGAMNQYQQPFQQPYSPYTPNSAAPMVYAQSPFSPIAPSVGSSAVNSYGSAHDSQVGMLASAEFLNRSPSGRTLAATAIPPTFNHSAQNQNLEQYAAYPELSRDPARLSMPIPTSEYVDVTRSSVTPFQAAQYAEISKKLNTQPPNGLPTPEVDQYVHSRQLSAPQEAEEMNRNDVTPAFIERDAVSPFADPVVAADVPDHLESHEGHAREQDGDDLNAHELEFPVPPSPVVTAPSRYRIDSMPPSLPEIRVQSRSSFATYDFPSSARASPTPGDTPLSSEFSSEMNTPTGRGLMAPGSFPTTPSPLASSFVIQSPPATQSAFSAPSSSQIDGSMSEAQQKEEEKVPPEVQTQLRTDTKRPETVYDPEDAYGGI